MIFNLDVQDPRERSHSRREAGLLLLLWPSVNHNAPEMPPAQGRESWVSTWRRPCFPYMGGRVRTLALTNPVVVTCVWWLYPSGTAPPSRGLMDIARAPLPCDDGSFHTVPLCLWVTGCLARLKLLYLSSYSGFCLFVCFLFFAIYLF